ncbi:polysaccharide deacetylase family protein [PVC group bacterium]|nr:polysaccharide deacetylase family protein [PVC group bacterium]
MSHLLTIDVEEWYHGLGHSAGKTNRNLSDTINDLLDVLSETDTYATFFILGTEVHKLKNVMHRCVAAGHEIGCHGMRHVRVNNLKPDDFHCSLNEARSLIEDATQKSCRGFRAPWFSVNPEDKWFFEILKKEGFVYDASLRIPLQSIHRKPKKYCDIIEVPVPLLECRCSRRNAGLLGGLTFRLLPKKFIQRLMHQCESNNSPLCLYLHPYEWEKKKCPANSFSMSTIRRIMFVSQTLPKLRWLINVSAFSSIERWLNLPL